MRGTGSALFVAILLMIAGVLNIVDGIAAVGNSHFWVNETQFVFSSLQNMGLDHDHPRCDPADRIAVAARRRRVRPGDRDRGREPRGDPGALLDIGGAHPWWAVGVFAVCIICVHGLVVLGEPKSA